MNTPTVDIIVPVWNRPEETRACLVNLIEHSSPARLILLNNGCDRETERLLEEFAEGLDERALLITSRVNMGFIRAVNMGFDRSDADFTAVVRTGAQVGKGWLDPLLALAIDRKDAGIVVPRLVEGAPGGRETGKASPVHICETSHGSFSGMLIRKELHRLIGYFDPEMDAGEWCLKDYARRALRAGFLTFAVEGSPVYFQKEPFLGSVLRRREVEERSRTAYLSRWGEERGFCVYFPKSADPENIREKLAVMLVGARQGHSFSVLITPRNYREVVRRGGSELHASITLEKLPRFFSEGRAADMADSLRTRFGALTLVAGIDGARFPGSTDCITFAQLSREIAATAAEKYSPSGGYP